MRNDGYSDAKGEVVLNKSAGFLLRTKVNHSYKIWIFGIKLSEISSDRWQVAKVEDGGVAAGVAVLDCPYLT